MPSEPLVIRAIKGQTIERFPVWMMRQAGRYMEEYRRMKERYSFAEMCLTPELSVEVALQPMKAFGFDAAILFSDIMIPARALGFEVEFAPGPVVKNPVTKPEDLKRLPLKPDLESLEPVFEAVRQLRASLTTEALFGFAATPWTLACYLLDQKPFKHFERTVIWSQSEREFIHDLLNRLTDLTTEYCLEQVRAGAQIIQLFDSWGGILPASLYEEFSLPYANRIFDRLRAEGASTVLYVNGAAHLKNSLSGAAADGLSIDSKCSLRDFDTSFTNMTLQGNFEPAALFSKDVELQTHDMLTGLTRKTRFIANLGHGILQETPRSGVSKFVETIKSFPIHG